MKNKLAIGILIAVLFYLINASSSFANVFASGIAVNKNQINPAAGETVSISYRLNESADQGVTIKIYNSSDQLVRTINGGTARGLNTVLWDGKDDSGATVLAGDYYFVVTASDDGHAKWEMISLDEPGNIVYAGKGIDVNKNPENPYYGVVYINSSATGTSTNPGAVKQFDGVISCWPNGEFIAQFIDTTNFNKKSGNSPFRISVGDDDNIYIADYSDGWESVWSVNGDLSEASLVQILARDDADPSTAPIGNHGSTLTTICRGIGANRILYISDEDFQDYDVWKFSINEGPFPYTATGTMLITESDSMADVWDFDLDQAGKYLYACDDQDAANPLNPTPPPSFSKWDISTDPATCIWSSPTTDIVHNIDGVGLYEKGNILAGGCKTGDPYLYIMDAATGAFIDTVINPGGGRNRDVAFDAVGNLYVVNNSIEWWRAFSPPHGPNSSSTKATFKIGVVTAVNDKTADEGVPKEFKLYQCYPNPFNSSTVITYDVPSKEQVTLKVFNFKGAEIKTLVDGVVSVGSHSVIWDGTDNSGQKVTSGLYLYTLQIGNQQIAKRMVLVK